MESIAPLEQRCTAYLLSLGMNAREARATLDSLVYAERRGHPSHGLNRIFSGFIQKAVKSGLMEPNSLPRLLPASSGGQLYFDGNCSIGYYGIRKVLEAVVEASCQNSVVFCNVNNLYPTNVLAEYAELLCDRGLICYITSKSPDKVTAPVRNSDGLASIDPVVGTNAFAWGFPAVGNEHVIFDTSMAGATNGELLRSLAEQRQDFEKYNYLTRSLTHPNDPSELFDSNGAFDGRILPFGGAKSYKGFGNLLVAELFNLLQESNHTGTSTTIIALRPVINHLPSLGGAFRAKVEASMVHKGGESARLPFSRKKLPSRASIFERHRSAIEALPVSESPLPAVDLRLEAGITSTVSLRERLVERVVASVRTFFPDLAPHLIDGTCRGESLSDRFFDEWSMDYQLPSLSDHEQLVRTMLAHAEFSSEDSLLDIGCGDGSLIRRLPALRRVLGIDVSPAMIDAVDAVHHTDLQLAVCDFLDFRSEERFSFVTAVMALHHIPHNRKTAALERVRQHLAPGGLFLLGETFLDSEDLTTAENLLNIAELYLRKVFNCLSKGIIGHGMKDISILRRVLDADGEFMVTRSRWCRLIEAAGLEVVTAEVTSPLIGYGYIVARNPLSARGIRAERAEAAVMQP